MEEGFELQEKLKDPEMSYQLYLNSRSATITDTTKMSKMSFKLNDTLCCPQEYNMYVSLVSAEIPNTMYNTAIVPISFTVDNSNNKVFLGLFYQNTNTITTITLTNGVYQGINGFNSIAFQLSKAYYYSQTINGIIDPVPINLSVIYNPTIQLFTLNSDRNSAYQASIYIQVLGNGGTSGGTYTFLSFPFNTLNVQPYQTSGFVSSTRYLLLASNLNTPNQAVGVSKQSIIDKIPVDVPLFSYIFYKNWLLYRTRISNRHIDTIQLTLLDDQGNEANLNSSNWSCTIQVEYRKINNITH